MRLPFQFFLHFFFGHLSEAADESQLLRKSEIRFGEESVVGLLFFPIEYWIVSVFIEMEVNFIDLFWSTDAKAEQWKQNKTLNNFIKIHKQFFWLLWFVVELNW